LLDTRDTYGVLTMKSNGYETINIGKDRANSQLTVEYRDFRNGEAVLSLIVHHSRDIPQSITHACELTRKNMVKLRKILKRAIRAHDKEIEDFENECKELVC